MKNDKILNEKIFELKVQQKLDVEKIKNLFENELKEFRQENTHLNKLREKTNMILLKKEAEIKILRQKIMNDDGMKNSQVEFSNVLCKI